MDDLDVQATPGRRWPLVVASAAMALLVGGVAGYFIGTQRTQEAVSLAASPTPPPEDDDEGPPEPTDADFSSGVETARAAEFTQDETYEALVEQSDGSRFNIEMSVREVDPSWPGRYSEPEEDRFVAVMVHIVNDGPSVLTVNPNHFTLEDEFGTAYDYTIGREPSLSHREMSAGEQVSAWLTFDIPADGTWRFTWLGPSGTQPLARWELGL